MTDPRTDVHDPRHIAALWTGVLLAPVAALANLEFAYLTVRGSCVHASTLPVHLVHASFLLIALAGLFVARHSWRNEGSLWADDEGGPVASSRFLASLGVLGSLLFCLVIVAQWIPTLEVHPCQ